ncbi:MFS family permease [Geodermatophilus sabuli]|uniref:Predicted arabinose efflux permease, MFS family n=1 Tax=Geodermatophilus sabuli TaxID=1564158 RepID=A0A285ED99_9ACTN|nr:MFS family permease [Geodermatophilus sabuli]SNX96056.1 Predicted arabinose efflux permease, MFS family [Geodermatophilus sabuli]
MLYVSAAVVFLGVMAQTVARGWLAFELTGSNAALGGVLLAFGVTMLVATPWGGVAADRLPKRLVLQVALSLLAVSSAGVGLAVAVHVVEYWMLLVASALQAVGFALFNPARMAFLAELVPRGSIPVAVSLLLVNAEVNRVVGPAIAGLVIGSLSFGTAAVFLATGMLSSVGLLLTAALPPGRRVGEASDRSPLTELADGLRYVRRRPDLLAPLLCGLGVALVGLPYLAFLPTVASDLFGLGSAGYGILSAASAVGAVVTGLLLGRRSYRRSETRVMIVAGATCGVALGALAVAQLFAVAVGALLVVGGAMLAFQTTDQSVLIARSAMEYHGRIQGLIMLSWGAFGIAALPLGVLADAVGLRWTLGGMGLAVVLVTGVFAVVSRRGQASSDRLRDLG